MIIIFFIYLDLFQGNSHNSTKTLSIVECYGFPILSFQVESFLIKSWLTKIEPDFHNFWKG